MRLRCEGEQIEALAVAPVEHAVAAASAPWPQLAQADYRLCADCALPWVAELVKLDCEDFKRVADCYFLARVAVGQACQLVGQSRVEAELAIRGIVGHAGTFSDPSDR